MFEYVMMTDADQGLRRFSDLRELHIMAEPLGRGNFFQRFWRSKKDEETLKTIKDGTSDAIMRFQVGEHLSSIDPAI